MAGLAEKQKTVLPSPTQTLKTLLGEGAVSTAVPPILTCNSSNFFYQSKDYDSCPSTDQKTDKTLHGQWL